MPDGDGPITRPYLGPAEPVRHPPSNIDAERAVLGALLANNKALDRVPFLEPHHFADDVNGRVFQEIRRLIGENRVADAVTLKTVLEQSGVLKQVGGVGYLTNLISCMVGIITTGDYGRVVQRTWLRRELIEIGEMLTNQAFGDVGDVDPMLLAADTVAMLDQVTMSGRVRDSAYSLAQAMAGALLAMREAKERGKSAGISTGFDCIDARLGGLEPGQVYTLAGRPGSGKSSLGHQIALNVAGFDIPVLELSLEMSATQLGRRALSAEARVPLFVMKGGFATPEQEMALEAAEIKLRDRPLIIDDAGGLTPQQIAAKCRAAKRKQGGLGLLMLDHLNLTRPDDNDAKHGPTYVIERAAGMMLQIAKDCEVPVLMLTQLNRGVEGREDKRPGLPDLRQSGAIEENSYAVGFLYRREYYLQNEPVQGGRGDDEFTKIYEGWVKDKNDSAGKAELIWAKVRDGETATDQLTFDGKTTRFADPEQRSEGGFND